MARETASRLAALALALAPVAIAVVVLWTPQHRPALPGVAPAQGPALTLPIPKPKPETAKAGGVRRRSNRQGPKAGRIAAVHAFPLPAVILRTSQDAPLPSRALMSLAVAPAVHTSVVVQPGSGRRGVASAFARTGRAVGSAFHRTGTRVAGALRFRGGS